MTAGAAPTAATDGVTDNYLSSILCLKSGFLEDHPVSTLEFGERAQTTQFSQSSLLATARTWEAMAFIYAMMMK